MQSVPKDVSAVPRPVRVTRPLGWYTTTPEGVTLVGAGMNVFLAALKLVAGMVAGSASLVADAGHSLSDLVTDAVCMLALRLRNKRAEALCTLSIGSILCATGIGMTSAAGTALISPTRAGAACGAHLAATVRGSQGAALLVAILSVISCAAPPAPLLACSLSSVSRAASASGTSRHQYRATLRGVCAWGSGMCSLCATRVVRLLCVLASPMSHDAEPVGVVTCDPIVSQTLLGWWQCTQQNLQRDD